jgi:hypothetical protein
MTLLKLGMLALSCSLLVACNTTDRNMGGSRMDSPSSNSGNLDDLVGMRGSSGERQLEERGYDYIKTVKVNDSSITYWWNSRQQHCIAVNTRDGRYDAINDQPEAVCGDDRADAGSGSGGSLDNLVGMRASGGERELEDRGYRFVNSSKSSDRIWSNWWNRSERKCITVVTMDGRYDSVTDTLPADCDRR